MYIEIQYALENLEELAANTSKSVKLKVWAFSTETSVDTKIPHYQIYLEFDKLIRNSSIYQSLDALLANCVHIVTKKVYNSRYNNYCLKISSNLNFDSKYYWKRKLSSDNLKETCRCYTIKYHKSPLAEYMAIIPPIIVRIFVSVVPIDLTELSNKLNMKAIKQPIKFTIFIS